MKYLIPFSLILLSACLPAPSQPLIVEQPIPCSIPALRERDKLPAIEWLPQDEIGENRCLSEDEYMKLKQLVAILRSHEQYLIESYNAIRNRCGGER